MSDFENYAEGERLVESLAQPEHVPFDYEAARRQYAGIPAFQELEAQAPDAIKMVTSHEAEQAVVDAGGDVEGFWETIGEGDGGFYDDIRKNGCSSCGSTTPGCCDACA